MTAIALVGSQPKFKRRLRTEFLNEWNNLSKGDRISNLTTINYSLLTIDYQLISDR